LTGLTAVGIVKLIFKTLLALFTLATAALGLAQDVSDPLQARQIAKEAYIYGYPLVKNYRVQYSRFAAGGWNTIRDLPNSREQTAYPKLDTLESYVPVDLRGEPLILEVYPQTDDRYYAVQLTDLYTYNFAHLGTRVSSTNLGIFLLVGPSWKSWKGWKPVGVYQIIECETDLAFLFYRTIARGPGVTDSVAAARQNFAVYPLSQYLGQPPAAAPPEIGFMSPLSAEDERTSTDFFKELNFVLQFCPTNPAERDLMARFARIGIGPGQTFEPLYYDALIQQAIRKGMADAWKDYDDAKSKLEAGSLSFSSLFGSRDELGNNYIYRMLGAVEGLNTDSRIEQIEDRYFVASTGGKLSGKTARYRLRFGPDQLPPVNAAWSVTLYSLPSKQIFSNPLDRYSINSTIAPTLVRDPDGGLTILVQKDSPEDADGNWLPAPNGPFVLSLRLYSPKPQAFEGSWAKPALKKL
jgi:hypothetical protein